MGVKVVSLNGGWHGAGVRVVEVETASPADKIGILPDDILVSVGSTTLKREDDLATAHAHLVPKQLIAVVIARGDGSTMTIRNMEPIEATDAAPSAAAAPAAAAPDASTDSAAVTTADTVRATIGGSDTAAGTLTTNDASPGVAAAAVAAPVALLAAAPASDSAVTQDPLATVGIQCANLSHDLASALGVATDSGVVVLQVTTGGSADRVGLRGGDVISAADSVILSNVGALASALRAAPSGTTLHVMRRDDERDVTVSLIPPPAPPAETTSAKEEAMEKELQSLHKEIEELRHQVAAGGKTAH